MPVSDIKEIASVRTRLMKIALLGFNVIRPRGRDRLGLSCGIYGNGFGVRRETLLKVPYRAVSVVEDVENHLRLIGAGLSVRFVDSTAVCAEMPVQGKDLTSQRERWEGGRLRLCVDQAPRLVAQILRGRMRVMEPLLDLLLLPLAFHVTLLLLAAILASGAIKLLSTIGLLVISLHIAAVIASDEDWQDVAALGAAPFYVLWKLGMIPRLVKNVMGRQLWVRTERASERSGTHAR